MTSICQCSLKFKVGINLKVIEQNSRLCSRASPLNNFKLSTAEISVRKIGNAQHDPIDPIRLSGSTPFCIDWSDSTFRTHPAFQATLLLILFCKIVHI
jgi:hypothetical protein